MSGEWITHDGGPCPVSQETRVNVKFRDGRVDDINPAKAFFWSSGTQDWWRHEGDRHNNIIAYREVAA